MRFFMDCSARMFELGWWPIHSVILSLEGTMTRSVDIYIWAMIAILFGCEPSWQLKDVQISNASGTATVTGNAFKKDDYTSLGMDLEVKFFDDGYKVVIAEETVRNIGRYIEVDEAEAFEASHYSAKFKSAGGDYEKICAKLMSMDAGLWDWQNVGCLTSVEPPEDDGSSGSGAGSDSGSGSGSSDTDCIHESSCCKVCDESKACGDSCIPASSTCHQPRGCACDSWEVC